MPAWQVHCSAAAVSWVLCLSALVWASLSPPLQCSSRVLLDGTSTLARHRPVPHTVVGRHVPAILSEAVALGRGSGPVGKSSLLGRVVVLLHVEDCAEEHAQPFLVGRQVSGVVGLHKCCALLRKRQHGHWFGLQTALHVPTVDRVGPSDCSIACSSTLQWWGRGSFALLWTRQPQVLSPRCSCRAISSTTCLLLHHMPGFLHGCFQPLCVPCALGLGDATRISTV